MKQIIPFKKELLFKTKVSEITSISLEHTLTLKDEDLISGEFHISGDYKMTEGSINREMFKFKLPFDIALDSRYDINTIIIDIDNFYYEVINNESLQVNIDVYVEGVKLEEINEFEEKEKTEIIKPIEEDKKVKINSFETTTEEEINTVPIITPPSPDSIKDDFSREEKIEFEVEYNAPQKAIIQEEITKKEVNTKNEFNIFENIDNSDTYITYYVYIVKDNDNIDAITKKYNVTKEDISLYNNLEEIKPGTKLIIPNANE